MYLAFEVKEVSYFLKGYQWMDGIQAILAISRRHDDHIASILNAVETEDMPGGTVFRK